MDETTETTLLDAATEEQFEQALLELIREADFGLGGDTYEDAGVMTYNRGLVIRTSGGEFQITINQAR